MARGQYKQKKAQELADLLMEYERRQAARDPNNFIKQAATPRQADFLKSTALEALYGGAAGGGKSSALLIAALQYVHVPNYSALILRRTFTDLNLPGSIMDRAREWLTGTGAVWNDRDRRWTFPSGATLQFGFCDTEKDKYRYQGTEIQFLGVDELTQWPEEWYRYLLSRLRKREGMPVELRARCASNPGGIGHHWVRRRFVDPQTAIGEYVPAKLDDNPHLDQHSYRNALALLDVQTRSQLLDGNWVEDASGLVYKYDSAKNDVTFTPPLDHYVIGVDYGVTDATAVSVLGWAKNDPVVYVVDIVKQTDMIPSEAAEMVRSIATRYKPERIVGDMGGLGKGFIEEARRRFYLPIEAADKQNKRGFQSLLNGALERGELRVLMPHCKPLADEWSELPWNDARTKEADGFDNHCADSVLYAWRACRSYLETRQSAPLSYEQRVASEMKAHEEELAQRIRTEREQQESEYEQQFGFFTGGLGW